MVTRNPFYVNPGPGIGQELGQLGQTLAGAGQIMRERQQQERQQQRLGEGREAITNAFQSNDPNLIAQTMIDYPELAGQLQGAIKFKSDATKQNLIDSAREIVLNPGNARQILMDRVTMIQGEGGDPTDSILALKEFDENPEGALQNAKNLYATYDPQGFKAYQAAQPKAQAPTEYEYREGGVIFNPRTGETKMADVQPERKKVLKQVIGGVKYYTDGTEEPIGETEAVSNPVTGKRFTQEQAQDVLANAKEFQLKNGGFAVTLGSGLDTIDRMYSEGYDPTKAAWVGAAFNDGAVSNLLRSDEDQVFMGAIDEMINAIARRETGAAITEFERKDFFNRYMPRPGDSKKRLTQKRDSLERQLKSIAGQSGGVYEALKITGDDNVMTPKQETSETFVIESHPEYGNISEADIQETMRANNLTREEVISRLGAQ